MFFYFFKNFWVVQIQTSDLRPSDTGWSCRIRTRIDICIRSRWSGGEQCGKPGHCEADGQTILCFYDFELLQFGHKTFDLVRGSYNRSQDFWTFGRATGRQGIVYIFADASNPHQPLTVTKTRYLIEKLRTTRCLGFMYRALARVACVYVQINTMSVCVMSAQSRE